MAPKGSVLVIGTGAAGSAAARSLSRNGWKVSVAECDRVGGTCLWRGCIPKKSLYHSATVARLLRDSDRFGVDVTSSNVDWQGVLAWKWHAQESYAGNQEAKLEHEGIELLRGDARFVSEEEVDVAGTTVRPDHIVLATGSHVVLLDIPGTELADTSEDALRYASRPESLVIVGGGFIALEMAGIYASFGTEVIVISKERRILEMLDEELATEAATQLDALGVKFITGASVDSIEGGPGSLKVKAVDSDDGTSAVLSAERVLQAVGRMPALDTLDLEAAGVAVDEHGKLVLDAYLRTTNPRVWAAGDAAGGMMQTPVANLEGHTVASSIDSGTPQSPDCSIVPITCYTVPQLATVGLTEKDARDGGRDVKVTRTDLGNTGAGVVAGETRGFFKLVCDAGSGKILGAQCAAPDASELIYSAAVAIRGGLTSHDIGKTLSVHPSMADVVYYSGG